jgi:hypothetical protein
VHFSAARDNALRFGASGRGTLKNPTLFGGPLASGSQLRIQCSFFSFRRSRPDIEMLEQFFDRLEAPFGLVRFNIDQFKSRLVVGGMSCEVAKVAK